MKKMEGIGQKLLMPLHIRKAPFSDEIIVIDQFSNDLKQVTEHFVEKQSIPALIDALKKFVE